MSIIYEALKKVEKKQGVHPVIPPQDTPKNPIQTKKIKPLQIVIYALALAIGIISANIIFSIVSRKPQSVPVKQTQKPAITNTPSPTPAVVPAPAPVSPPAAAVNPPVEELTLSGLFFSNDKGYALINNRILKEGDEINGAVVKRITLEEVELESGGRIIKLSNIN